MSNLYLDDLIKLGADGVDFVPIFTPEIPEPEDIIVSYTKEQMYEQQGFPKTSRRYWKMENGEKKYIKYK